MKIVGQVFTWIFVVVALGALTLGAIELVSWFLSLEPGTQVPVASVTGVVLVPIIAFFTTRSLDRRRSLETSLREKKTELYDQLIRDLVSILDLAGLGQTLPEGEIKEMFAKTTPPLITYGSRGVILAWNAFRRTSREHAEDTKAIMLSFEALLKSMRKDLGHTVVTTQNGELLGIFINDVDEIFK